jgi:putative transposase
MQLEGKAGFSILEACDAARVSRAGFYRYFDEHLPRQADTELRQQIQKICLDNRCYGSRRVLIELRKQGRLVNRKRVMRLMRADNLLCLRKRRFVCTTDSRHTYAVYPNLTRDWKPDGINQLWVADITYIRLETEFVYLAVVIDAFSRRVIGWALDRTMDDLTLSALGMALELRRPASGLVHHSDRGSQYASGDYTDVLKAHGCQISMSHKGSPWENGGCESWMKTLKYEEVYRQEYRDLSEARASLERFIEKVYNQKRLHSALGYLPPVEFEQALLTRAPAPGSTMPAGEIECGKL